jgi:hypothetical protein
MLQASLDPKLARVCQVGNRFFKRGAFRHATIEIRVGNEITAMLPLLNLNWIP